MINYSATEFTTLVGKYDTTIFAFMEEIGQQRADRSIIEEMFTRQDVDEPDVAISGTSAHGRMKKHKGTRNYEDIQEYFTKKIEFEEFSLTELFGRKFLDDNKLLNMKNRSGGLMNSAYNTQEDFAAAIFTNADQSSFTMDGETYTWTLSADAVSFVNDTHSSKTGKVSSTYLDNKGAITLDGGNLDTAIVTMGQFTDDVGNQGSFFGDTLLVGLENAKTALELANSDKKPTVANNDYNVYQGMFKVIVWNKLRKQTSKTGSPWFWLDSRNMKENLYFLDRVKPEITDNRNWQTMSWEVGIYARFGIGIYLWQWCFGGIPA
ncbi:MAG: hypothetical protein PHQ35_09310 [Phycisphaerae bacterium]|nr:hypothetical protein [Phycisphaerae bacterium]MDD5239914.1 hypothetical protein [Candidatus Nanoarchaeia archaeon]